MRFLSASYRVTLGRANASLPTPELVTYTFVLYVFPANIVCVLSILTFHIPPMATPNDEDAVVTRALVPPIREPIDVEAVRIEALVFALTAV
jgi:heme/copper-type cytochrome/quinol oxidase subunit 2